MVVVNGGMRTLPQFEKNSKKRVKPVTRHADADHIRLADGAAIGRNCSTALACRRPPAQSIAPGCRRRWFETDRDRSSAARAPASIPARCLRCLSDDQQCVAAKLRAGAREVDHRVPGPDHLRHKDNHKSERQNHRRVKQCKLHRRLPFAVRRAASPRRTVSPPASRTVSHPPHNLLPPNAAVALGPQQHRIQIHIRNP